MSDSTPLSIIVIIGPTAVGKTETALLLAERLDGEIVSADSRLFYRGMDIGTAKPSQVELQRVPHHLIDIANPDENWSLAVFQQAARQTIASIHARNRLPLLVGGTGQYIQSVLHGWQVPKTEPNPRLRQAIEGWAAEISPAGLHKRLTILDPVAATRIDFRNVRRTVRALEVIFTTGRPFSEQSLRGPSLYRTLIIGLIRPRVDLYARVDARIDSMLQAGLVEEVRTLLQSGYPPTLPAFSAIGYREIISYLRGEIELEEAVRLIKRNTRIFVRRQANWFKQNDPAILWFDAGENPVDQIEAVIRSWL